MKKMKRLLAVLTVLALMTVMAPAAGETCGEGEHTWENGICTKCQAVCQHAQTETDAKDENTHLLICATCHMTVGEEAHTLVYDIDGEYHFGHCSKYCGYTLTDEVVEHQYVPRNRGDGTHLLMCVCGAVPEGAAAEEHTFGGWTAVDGTDTHKRTCSVCGAEETQAHDWADANCTEPKTCKGCGLTDGDPLGHDWADADCEHPKTCKVCGATDGDPLGHDLADIAAQAATCLADGHEAYQACSRCDYTTPVTVIKAKGAHTPMAEPDIPATCTQEGKQSAVKCAVCGEELEKEQTIPVKDHTLVKTEAAAPTCTEEGNDAYWTCSVCGRFFADEKGNTEIAANSWIKDATGHTPVTDPAVAATCVTDGLTEGSHCDVCGAVLAAQTVVACVGHHTPGAEVTENRVNAQVGVPGSYEQVIYCSDCGTELSRVKWTIPALEPQQQNAPAQQAQQGQQAQQAQQAQTAQQAVTNKTAPASKTAGAFDTGDRIEIEFYSDGTFVVHMENGSTERGTYMENNGKLVLQSGGFTFTVGEDGSFTYVSPLNPERSYAFRLSAGEMQDLIKAARGEVQQPAMGVVEKPKVVQINIVNAFVDKLAADLSNDGKTLALGAKDLKKVLKNVNTMRRSQLTLVKQTTELLGGNWKIYRSNGKEAIDNLNLTDYKFISSFDCLELQGKQPVDRYGNPQPIEVRIFPEGLAGVKPEEIADTLLMIYDPVSGEIAFVQLDAGCLNTIVNPPELTVTIPFPGLITFIQKNK